MDTLKQAAAKQSEALRMADACDTVTKLMIVVPGLDTTECAAELRRLHGVNAELLQELLHIANADTAEWYDHSEFEAWAKSRARFAIAKATGVQQ